MPTKNVIKSRRKRKSSLIRILTLLLLLISFFAFKSLASKKTSINTQAASVKIIGGEDAKPSEFPFMAAVIFDDYNGTSYCGGSLIKKKFVLTADHCVYNQRGQMYKESEIRIFFNKIFIGDLLFEKDESKFYKAKKIYSYNGSYNYPLNDIALIELEEAPKNIPSVTLATKNQENFYTIGNEVTVIGYGANNVSYTIPIPALLNFSNEYKLKKIKFSLIDRPQILKDFLKKIYFGSINETSSKNTCVGDSGSPILFKYKGRFGYRFYQIGAVSGGGKGICHGSTHGVKIIDFLVDFINPITNE